MDFNEIIHHGLSTAQARNDYNQIARSLSR